MKYSVKDKEALGHHIYETDKQVVTHLNIEKDKEVPTHDSPMSVIVVIYEGEVLFTEDDQTYTILPGDIVQMDPSIKHSLKAVKDSKLMVIKSELA